MEIVKRFVILFCVFQCTFLSVSASNESSEFHENETNPANCELPPPDSFHIISRSSELIELAWNPISVDAIHTLKAYTRPDSSSAWELFGEYYDLPGSTFSLSGPGLGQNCRLLLYTNCGFGEPSIYPAVLELDKIIIDLVVGGRIPINPVPVSCTRVNLDNHDWVGFKVIENIPGSLFPEGFLFEIIKTGKDHLEINRILPNNVIVAADQDHIYPSDPSDLIRIYDDAFRVVKLLPTGGFFDVGRIEVKFYQPGNKIDICIKNEVPKWNSNFTYTTLVAEETEESPNPKSTYSLFYSQNIQEKTNIIRSNSPFSSNLIIFASEDFKEGSDVDIIIRNLNGQIVLKNESPILQGKLSYEVGNLAEGLYIIEIKQESIINTLKVIKINN
ncbi:MAG: hypothetical protein R3A50_10065 [Saprospiraceae bacterium]